MHEVHHVHGNFTFVGVLRMQLLVMLSDVWGWRGWGVEGVVLTFILCWQSSLLWYTAIQWCEGGRLLSLTLALMTTDTVTMIAFTHRQPCGIG